MVLILNRRSQPFNNSLINAKCIIEIEINWKNTFSETDSTEEGAKIHRDDKQKVERNLQPNKKSKKTTFNNKNISGNTNEDSNNE